MLKNKLLIFIAILASTASAQKYTIADYLKDDYLKTHIVKGGLLFVAGAADGQAEALRFHYSTVKDVWPEINDDFWNPSTSWKNKYKNGDVNQGEAFPLSTTSLVFVTDGYHLCRAVRKSSITIAVAAPIQVPIGWGYGYKKPKKTLKHYVVDFIYYSISYSAGFWATYEILYKK